MNFFGLLWVVSAFSSFLIPQTTPRLLEDFSKVIHNRTVSLVRRIDVTSTQSKSQPSLGATQPNSLLIAKPSSQSPQISHSGAVALFNSEPSILIQQFIGGLFRKSDNIRSVFGRVTPIVTITIADNPCAAPSSHSSGWGFWHDWRNNSEFKSNDLNLVHCTGLWQTDWSRTEPIEHVFQVRVRGRVAAEVPTYTDAEAIARQLYQVLRQPNFTPYRLIPAIVNGIPTGKAGDKLLFSVKPEWAALLDRNPELLAIHWTNNLRVALNAPALSVAEAQSQMYGLVPTDRQMTGVASWYGPYFHGRLTATGEVYNQHELTAAHPSLPFNTYLKVINKLTGKTVIVRINDRGPYFENRSLDLSLEAARCLGSEVKGVVPYEAVIMEKADIAQFNQENWTTASLIDRQFSGLR